MRGSLQCHVISTVLVSSRGDTINFGMLWQSYNHLESVFIVVLSLRYESFCVVVSSTLVCVGGGIATEHPSLLLLARPLYMRTILLYRSSDSFSQSSLCHCNQKMTCRGPLTTIAVVLRVDGSILPAQ